MFFSFVVVVKMKRETGKLWWQEGKQTCSSFLTLQKPHSGFHPTNGEVNWGCTFCVSWWLNNSQASPARLHLQVSDSRASDTTAHSPFSETLFLWFSQLSFLPPTFLAILVFFPTLYNRSFEDSVLSPLHSIYSLLSSILVHSPGVVYHLGLRTACRPGLLHRLLKVKKTHRPVTSIDHLSKRPHTHLNSPSPPPLRSHIQSRYIQTSPDLSTYPPRLLITGLQGWPPDRYPWSQFCSHPIQSPHSVHVDLNIHMWLLHFLPSGVTKEVQNPQHE